MIGLDANSDPSENSHPISVGHTVDARKSLLFVDWSLNNYCNYRCSYCPPHLHSGGIEGPELYQVVRLIKQISEGSPKPWKHFQFTGGEPTVYKYIGRALDLVKAQGHTAGLISNGSRSVSWWLDHESLIDEVTLSFHIEMADRRHFLNVIEHIESSINTHVNIAMLPDRFDECVNFANLIAANFEKVSITLKPLLIDFKTQLYPYNAHQRLLLQTYGWPNRHPTERAKGHMLVTFSDGRREKLKASRLVALNYNSFLGWSCDIGLELICVKSSGEIYRGVCREGGQLGSVAEGIKYIPDAPVTCQRSICNCLADISVSKRKACGQLSIPLMARAPPSGKAMGEPPFKVEAK
jgi:organic radical activating enzyme